MFIDFVGTTRREKTWEFELRLEDVNLQWVGRLDLWYSCSCPCCRAWKHALETAKMKTYPPCVSGLDSRFRCHWCDHWTSGLIWNLSHEVQCQNTETRIRPKGAEWQGVLFRMGPGWASRSGWMLNRTKRAKWLNSNVAVFMATKNSLNKYINLSFKII